MFSFSVFPSGNGDNKTLIRDIIVAQMCEKVNGFIMFWLWQCRITGVEKSPRRECLGRCDGEISNGGLFCGMMVINIREVIWQN